MDAVSQRIADWFETLEPGSLDIITSIYAAEVGLVAHGRVRCLHPLRQWEPPNAHACR